MHCSFFKGDKCGGKNVEQSEEAFEAPRGRRSRAVVTEGSLGGDADIMDENLNEKREARAVGQRNLFACEGHQAEMHTRNTGTKGNLVGGRGGEMGVR